MTGPIPDEIRPINPSITAGLFAGTLVLALILLPRNHPAAAMLGNWCVGDSQCIYDHGFRRVATHGIQARDAAPDDDLGVVEAT